MMASTEDHASAVLALVAEEPVEPGDLSGVAGRLQRLCRAARHDLPASGVGVCLVSESGDLMTAAASSLASAGVEDLQLTMGEGPCLAASASGTPVLVADLSEAARTIWFGYGPAALDCGVRAVFAFPLQIGSARLGALDAHRDEPGALSRWALARALTYAEVAMEILMGAEDDSGEETWLFSHRDDTFVEVYQAQGMVMVQLDVGTAEAMSRMRAHAFANNRRLRDVGDDIVGRRLTLEPNKSAKPGQ